MRSFYIALLLLSGIVNVHAQYTFKAYLLDKNSKAPIPGAVVNIPGSAIGNSANDSGRAMLTDIPAGRYPIHFAAAGYAERTDTFSFPSIAGDDAVTTIYLEPEELEEVVVSTTRSSRTIQDIATRIELIGAEEVEEKANMKPGDIRMMLGESTGIQVLQTSASSGNTGIRIQGMDGRYTQILKDGFPLYAGFAGGLGLLQTPPLNLKRVEIIKGASSTLYGGGAIAGLINLVSKTPANERELRFMLNGTSAGGVDVNGFYSQRYGKAGLTLYAAYDANAPYAPGNTVFTAIPKFSRYTFSPKLFLYLSPKTELNIGLNTAFEKRLGGDIAYIKDRTNVVPNTYFEQNDTKRISSELELTHKFDENRSMTIKNSVSFFDREIQAPAYVFDGSQVSSFSELNYAVHKERNEWVIGVNLFTDAFKDKPGHVALPRDYSLTTIGAFAQNTHDLGTICTIETGLRVDHIVDYGTVVLPRLSLLFKPGKKVTSRIGGGLGYKAPTIFTEESERILYSAVLPINTVKNTLERSYGANGDVNYKAMIGDKVSFSVNQLFFYTRIDHPLLLNGTPGYYYFVNADAHIDAQGAETNVKLGYKHFKLFLGYTYTHSQIHMGGYHAETPLTPRHHTNSVLMYEVPEKWKVGLEAYYYSPQKLGSGGTGRDHWLCGIMAERIWEHISVYINFENILDSRQSRFDGTFTNRNSYPLLLDIYAPMDGFVVNGGIKLRL